MTPTKNFYIYRASAGTGKTYTLVKEFLKLLISNPQAYQTILAITFTNKAAAEMKDRILNNLYGMVEQSSNPKIVSMISDLERELEKNDLELQNAAKQALTNILHNYSFFSINTIDSFVAKIVKTFSKELGFQPNFEVELNGDFFINEAIDIIISRVGQDEEITKVLIDFVKNNMDKEKTYKIEKSLYDFSKEIWKEGGMNERKKLKDFSIGNLIEIGDKIREKEKELKNKITAIATPIWERIEEEGLADVFYYKDKGIAGYFEHYTDFEEFKNVGKYILESINNDKWLSGKHKNIVLPSGLTDEMKSAFDEIEKIVPNLALYQLITRDLYSLSLLNEMGNIVNSLYDETGKVYIAEFNQRIADIISKEPIPFIYERVGTKYAHFFIDEFQDTSDLQWNNLAPLISNALASGNFNMIVGDGKQAIYRWRNGNVELFENLSSLQNTDHQNQKVEIFAKDVVTKVLNKNFRSKKTIVNFNNQFFQYIYENILTDGLKKIYDDHQFHSKWTENEGYVNIKLLQQIEGQDVSETVCQEIVNIIQTIQKQGFRLNDIAILARTNKTLSSIAEYLTAHNISISSAESLLLSQNSNVNLLCSLIRYTADSTRTVDKCFIVLWVMQEKQIKEDHHTLLQAVQNMSVDEFQSFLNQENMSVDFQKAKKSAFMDAVTDFIIDFKLDISDAYIRFFVDSLMEVINTEGLSLFDFKDWWDENGKNISLSIPDVNDAVKMLSIHKSKGLEFPFVILPFINEGEKNSPNKVWVDTSSDKDISLPTVLLPLSKKLTFTKFKPLYTEEEEKKTLDMLNLLYVSCTRPELGLFILTEKMETQKTVDKPSFSKILNAFVQCQAEETENFEWGTMPVSEQQMDKDRQDIQTLPPFYFKPWHQKIDLLNLKNTTSKFFETNAIRYGKTLHAALEKIITKNDIEKAVFQLNASGVVAKNEMPSLIQCLSRIVEHPKLQDYFSENAKVLTESDILLPGKNEFFRPDRVVIQHNKTVVIDYKTGKVKDEDVRQIQNYAETLLQMGYDVEQGFLVYIDRDTQDITIKELSFKKTVS